MAEHAVRALRRNHPQNDPDHKGKKLRGKDKKQGRRQAFRNQAGDRGIKEKAVAKIKLYNIAHIEAQLHEEWLV